MNSFPRRLATGLCLAALSLSSPALAAPEGGEVKAGSAAIEQTVGTTTVRQLTERAIVDWRSFSVRANERVRFLQPSELAVIMNRVTGGDPSLILGRLQANGQVFLLNPNGILFGPEARVDVGGLLATTLSLSDQDFLSGNYRFTQDPSFDLAAVVNQGTLRVSDGGYVVLTAPLVSNEGLIVANLGHVALGGAGGMALNLDGRNLVSYQIEPMDHDGTVVLTPEAVSQLLSGVINDGGLLPAGSLSEQDGEVRLEGGAGTVLHAGQIRAAGARLDATDLTVVDAVGQVNAEELIVWSDQDTVMAGTLTSSGGFIETSAVGDLTLTGSVMAGEGGTWLIDPPDLTIVAGVAGTNQVSASDINASLNAGSNVTLIASGGGAGSGNIVQEATATISKTAGANATLTLGAATGQTNINLNGDILSSAGALNVSLGAGGFTGAVTLSPLTDVATNNGTFSASGGGAYQAFAADIDTGTGTMTINMNGDITVGNMTGGSLTLASSTGRVLQGLGTSLQVPALTVATNGNDLMDNANDVDLLTVSGFGSFTYTDVDGLAVGPVSLSGSSLNLTNQAGNLQIVSPVQAGAIQLFSGGTITSAQGDSFDIQSSEGNVTLTAGSGIGAQASKIRLSQAAGTSLSLQTTGAGAPIHVEHDSDLGGLVVTTAGGTVSLTDSPGGATGQETLSFSAGVLSGAANTGTALTFSTTADVVLGHVSYPGGGLSLNSQGTLLDDGANNTRVIGSQISLQGLSVGEPGNAVDIQATGLNALALASDIEVTDYTGHLNLVANAPGRAVVRTLGGNLSVINVSADAVSLNAAGALTSPLDNFAEITGNNVLLNAGLGASVETNALNLRATAERSLQVVNQVTTNTAILDLISNTGSVQFTQSSPAFTVATVTFASAATTMNLANDNGNLTVRTSNSGGNTSLSALQGSLQVGGVSGDQLTLASGGSIEENLPDSLPDLVANDLTLIAQTGIGIGGALELEVETLSGLSAQGGPIDLVNLGGPLLVSSLVSVGPIPGDFRLINQSGDLTVESAGGNRAVRLEAQGGSLRLGSVEADTTLTALASGAMVESTSDAGVDLRAADLALTAGSGMSLDLSASTLQATGSGPGALDLRNSGGALTVTSATAQGDITLTNDLGSLVATNVSTGGAGSVTLRTTGAGNIGVGLVSATAHLITIDSAGSILEQGSDAQADLLAVNGAISLTATTGLGPANAIEISTGQLNASTDTGNLQLTELDGGVNVGLARTGSGNVVLESVGGDLAITGTATTLGSGDLTLKTTGSGNVLVNRAVAGGHDLTVSSAGEVRESGSDSQADLAARHLALTAAAGIGASGSVETDSQTIEATVTGTGSLDLTEVASGTTVTAATTAGNITLASNGGNLIVPSADTNSSGEISLTTNTSGAIVVGLVRAPGFLVQANAADSVLESGSDPSADLVASDLVLLSGTGIGLNDALEVNTQRLSASVLGTGPIRVTDVSSMVVELAETADGNIELTTRDGPLLVDLARAQGPNRSATLTSPLGDVRLDRVQATGAVHITAGGSILDRNPDAFVDLVAGANSVLRAEGGTISPVEALQVTVTDASLSVFATDAVGGVSVRLVGTVSPTDTLIVLTPAPPGDIFFNGNEVFP